MPLVKVVGTQIWNYFPSKFYVEHLFDPRKAAKIALAIVRLMLKSNHSSIDCVVFCTFENADYEICKDLMPIVYFSMPKHHLTDI